MTSPAAQTPADHPSQVAEEYGDYSQFTVTLPTEASGNQGLGARLTALLRGLAAALDGQDERTALREWLDAAEAVHGPISDELAREVFRDWAEHLEELEQQKRDAATDEWLAAMEAEHGPIPEEALERVRRWWPEARNVI